MDRQFSLKEIDEVAKELLDTYSSHNIWLFLGEMGAGKTTLIKSICDQIGVVDKMSSPTFSIVNEYITESGDELYHFDFYRMEDISEAVNIGIEDYFYAKNRCFIEWPEVIMPLLPSKYLEISIKLVDSNTRHLTVI